MTKNGISPNTIFPSGISKHPVLNIYYYLISGWDFDPVPDLRGTLLGFYGGMVGWGWGGVHE